MSDNEYDYNENYNDEYSSYSYNQRSTSNYSRGGDFRFTRHSDSSENAVVCQPLQVRVDNNFDKALRAFRAIVQKEKIVSQYKERQAYEKPSDKRRRKNKEARRKQSEGTRISVKDEDTPRKPRREKEDT